MADSRTQKTLEPIGGFAERTGITSERSLFRPRREAESEVQKANRKHCVLHSQPPSDP
jgi:hypothetical protein